MVIHTCPLLRPTARPLRDFFSTAISIDVELAVGVMCCCRWAWRVIEEKVRGLKDFEMLLLVGTTNHIRQVCQDFSLRILLTASFFLSIDIRFLRVF